MAEDIINNFCDNLKWILQEFNLSRAQIARLCKISQSCLRYEDPTYNPTLQTIQSIADALKIHWSILLLPRNSLEHERLTQFKNAEANFKNSFIVSQHENVLLKNCIVSRRTAQICLKEQRDYFKKLQDITFSMQRGIASTFTEQNDLLDDEETMDDELTEKDELMEKTEN